MMDFPTVAEPPEYARMNRFHWLIGRVKSATTIAEWIDGGWLCLGEEGPVSPKEAYDKGWVWFRPIRLPGVLRGGS